MRKKISSEKLKAFDSSFDPSYEEIAKQTRREFLKEFPVEKLSRMRIDDYVIGHRSPSFCTYVEVKTRPWASIHGATAFKFGIYYGKTKSDSTKTYRYKGDYENYKEAFRAVRSDLVALVKLGSQATLDFGEIDRIPLSQMFKAKILSLYFPEKFLNVCSGTHLKLLGKKLNLPAGLARSEYQHLLVATKNLNSQTKHWSNPKFMTFLYTTYISRKIKEAGAIQKPRRKSHRKVNFEDIQKQRDEIGRLAEEYAFEWETQRLKDEKLAHLKVLKKNDKPGFGYDLLSHNSASQPRFIEVKSVGKLPGREGYRFFLSDNEYETSKRVEHRKAYFFYLVFFNGKGKPFHLEPQLAVNFYPKCEMFPASYKVRFEFALPRYLLH